MSGHDDLIAAGMTPNEADVWELVRSAAGGYLRLTEAEPHHPMEREEICHAFHVIQGWLGARPFVRTITTHGTDRRGGAHTATPEEPF